MSLKSVGIYLSPCSGTKQEWLWHLFYEYMKKAFLLTGGMHTSDSLTNTTEEPNSFDAKVHNLQNLWEWHDLILEIHCPTPKDKRTKELMYSCLDMMKKEDKKFQNMLGVTEGLLPYSKPYHVHVSQLQLVLQVDFYLVHLSWILQVQCISVIIPDLICMSLKPQITRNVNK